MVKIFGLATFRQNVAIGVTILWMIAVDNGKDNTTRGQTARVKKASVGLKEKSSSGKRTKKQPNISVLLLW